MDVNTFTLKLEKKIALTHDVFELHFQKPPELSFKAGQFLQFEVPTEEKMLLRSYSISAHPDQVDLEFCIKIVPEGKASTRFKNAEIGDTFQVRGPRGMFVTTETTSLTCVATGAGIAPIMGLIQDELLNKKNTNPIHLLFGVRSEEDVFWTDRLESLKTSFPNFDFHITLSQPKDAANWNGLCGRVTQHIKVDPSHTFFLCGNPEMVKEVREILLKNTIEPKKMHFEIF